MHKIPKDLHDALIKDSKAFELWQSLTPLAQNEWICWVTSPKQDKTRENHVRRTISELKEGMRRPCCWIGCIHLKDKPLSPSVRGILAKRHKKR